MELFQYSPTHSKILYRCRIYLQVTKDLMATCISSSVTPSVLCLFLNMKQQVPVSYTLNKLNTTWKKLKQKGCTCCIKPALFSLCQPFSPVIISRWQKFWICCHAYILQGIYYGSGVNVSFPKLSNSGSGL